jgi:hypothetical protein
MIGLPRSLIGVLELEGLGGDSEVGSEGSGFDAWLSQGYDCLFRGVVSGCDEPPTTTLDKREDRNLILLVRSPYPGALNPPRLPTQQLNEATVILFLLFKPAVW